MKLKLVVASMSVLGLISGSAFAASTAMSTSNTATTTSTTMCNSTKSCACKKAHTQHFDYKNEAMAPVCTVSSADLTMAAITQNTGRALYDPCTPDWFNRIFLSGGVNVDLGKWGNRNANIMGENYQHFSLNDAYLNVQATINDWASAFASISFSNPTTNANPAAFNNFGAAEYSAAYANNIGGSANNTIQLEQAYATFGNFSETPFYLQVGKQFQDFSRYEIHPITASMTQVMSETLATSAKLGLLSAAGFHADISVFDDPINKTSGSSAPANYVLAGGYDQINDQFGWDIGIAYMYNLIGANDVAYNVTNFTGGGFNSRIGGGAVYGDVNSGPFTLGVRYTTALNDFNPADLPRNGVAGLVGNVIGGVPLAGAKGARPWAAGIQAGYDFNKWNRSQNIYVGYQASGDAGGLDLPQDRWLLGYSIDVCKSTSLGVEWDHDMAYNTAHGGTGNNTNLVSLRLGVEFA